MFRRMVWSSLVARRGRLALAFMAVTLGIAVATALFALALQVGDDLARTLRAAGPNFVVLPAGARLGIDLGGAAYEPVRAGLALRESALPELKRSFWKNNVLDATPELRTAVTLEHEPAVLLGTWFTRDVVTDDGPWRTGLARLHPQWTIEGRWPREDAAEIAVGRELAERIAVHAGESVTVELPGRAVRWRVSGVVTAGGLEDRQSWAPLSQVQSLAGRAGQIDRLWLSALVRPAPRGPAPDPVRDPKGYERFQCAAYPANVARELSGRLEGAEVLPASEEVAGEANVVERLNTLMVLLALAALAASTLGLLSTTTATVVERSVELGLLRSLGATSRQIAALLLGETLLVSVAGGFAGWLVGSLAAAAIRGQAFGAGAVVQPLLLPVAVVLAFAVAVLGTLGPLRLALRLDPAAVLRG